MCGVHIGEVTVVAPLQGKKKVECVCTEGVCSYLARMFYFVTWVFVVYTSFSDTIICMNM